MTATIVATRDLHVAARRFAVEMSKAQEVVRALDGLVEPALPPRQRIERAGLAEVLAGDFGRLVRAVLRGKARSRRAGRMP